ncbi:GtrA family protein [Bacillus cereus]|uniref:GtrA family protein n=1 Tax=Bacillus arachidis TaxID=2819290 RepID=A0ABS3NSX9_9BACI|nr:MULTISPECIES: GtrA family protein [Bacillus]PGX95982.1 GtrA family protein [Bacillus cereus]MBO1623670.1 GtrA family protein [Bacillus arachidis]PFE04849.1 GtrA family protein [Bacillus sp. AFS023182]WIY60865.1 GtrA family protein [Bacillus arachidis]SDZ30587.1 Putative flippase GtrA (transmembrane translocase of bactoprenol-linked glucose) [Bacillus sp. 166amftsu]
MNNKTKEIFNYLFFGGLTTLINIVTYFICATLVGMDYKIATTIAWIVAVLFAYITNKKYVFNSQQANLTHALKEFFYFMGFRILSYFIDLFAMIAFIEWLGINDLITKVIANIIVVVFNYFASKYVIFRKKTDVENGQNA